jgi:hypothetical protein
MAVRYCLDYLLAEPFPEFNYPLLVTRWAEMPALTGEGQEVFMATVFTSDTGKSIARVTTIKIAVNDFLHIRPEKAILPFKTIFINLRKCFKIIINASIIC